LRLLSYLLPSLSRSIATSTARSVRSSSQSINSSANVRVFGFPQTPDPVGSLEVGEHEDVEQSGAREPVRGGETLRESAL
jgi:hypothetical protein